MTERSYRWVFWLLALVGLSADQVSKYSVFAWLYDAEELKGSAEVIPGAFKIDVQYRSEVESGKAPFPGCERSVPSIFPLSMKALCSAPNCSFPIPPISFLPS